MITGNFIPFLINRVSNYRVDDRSEIHHRQLIKEGELRYAYPPHPVKSTKNLVLAGSAKRDTPLLYPGFTVNPLFSKLEINLYLALGASFRNFISSSIFHLKIANLITDIFVKAVIYSSVKTPANGHQAISDQGFFSGSAFPVRISSNKHLYS